jgi:hypothetical protein
MVGQNVQKQPSETGVVQWVVVVVVGTAVAVEMGLRRAMNCGDIECRHCRPLEMQLSSKGEGVCNSIYNNRMSSICCSTKAERHK